MFLFMSMLTFRVKVSSVLNIIFLSIVICVNHCLVLHIASCDFCIVCSFAFLSLLIFLLLLFYFYFDYSV